MNNNNGTPKKSKGLGLKKIKNYAKSYAENCRYSYYRLLNL